ncbi:hypothetical protein Q4517_05625 [Tenacibaculum sp. 1_MG-2023]|uniref:hypothetical protein n=1 Tax=Tenacibaculum sp. 1_MG-2023 TaxID=3062653 RepID=UPI0026E3B5BA|nr:hypothetical protein [Tenacibaculum sp. 1_MG-2023]MDO6675023.1 hypothetical protein [Tenacibaculum sp. 1_MG-2023]
MEKNTIQKLLYLLFLFSGLSLWSQGLTELSVISYSEKPDYERVHMHKLKISNNSAVEKEYRFSINSIPCKNQENIETVLEYSLLDEKMKPIIKALKVLPKRSKILYLKITKPYNIKLGSWNCIELLVNDLQEQVSLQKIAPSSKITIKTYTPNQSNDN